ncbi:flagellar biosynthesis repressor FlbT [Devosia sp. BK]|uniref:flagellar biosynthesis repressor FlbT n=1 Tax=Devosia sp. BK TaxID=2871706 RepID=UPI0029396A9D|nr:flagellar biosynthesis repressor FlbT [Devosia sp. BK]MDV3249743.1 flagellar biosynthesis repressor FlbT [Devosia sp. BK]
MALKLTLKPGEKLYVGTGMIYCDADAIYNLFIDGALPIVREKDYLDQAHADTSSRQIYLAIQQAYLENNFDAHRESYFRLTGMIIAELPGAMPHVAEINKAIGQGKLYNALKAARKLVQFEDGLLPEGQRSSHWQGFTA